MFDDHLQGSGDIVGVYELEGESVGERGEARQTAAYETVGHQGSEEVASCLAGGGIFGDEGRWDPGERQWFLGADDDASAAALSTLQLEVAMPVAGQLSSTVLP